VDYRDSPSESEFRAELRSWLALHSPRERAPEDPDAAVAFLDEWWRSLAKAGYVGLSFPSEYGGGGRPDSFDAILNEEVGKAGAPPPPPIAHIGQAILRHGTEDQRRQHLPGLLSCEVRWCQGFSEPGAGSDLAGLATSADSAPDGYRINGRKIWTSGAVWADWCLLLARTDREVAKHRGLSTFLLPMSRDGIECRPIVMATGSREFAELYLDDVAASRSDLLGAPGQGWEIALGLLAYERGPADMGWVGRFTRALAVADEDVRAGRIVLDESATLRLAEARVLLHVLQVHVQRSLCRRADGDPPGPEGSVDKLLMTRVDQLVHRLTLDLRGAVALLDETYEVDTYLWSRAQSIFGGTEQVQRSIVAERLLGLPRDRQ
jgi:alkylation response protein AidB-like acyl-CoA dehydrogenase